MNITDEVLSAFLDNELSEPEMNAVRNQIAWTRHWRTGWRNWPRWMPSCSGITGPLINSPCRMP